MTANPHTHYLKNKEGQLRMSAQNGGISEQKVRI